MVVAVGVCVVQLAVVLVVAAVVVGVAAVVLMVLVDAWVVVVDVVAWRSWWGQPSKSGEQVAGVVWGVVWV